MAVRLTQIEATMSQRQPHPKHVTPQKLSTLQPEKIPNKQSKAWFLHKAAKITTTSTVKTEAYVYMGKRQGSYLKTFFLQRNR